MKYIRSFFITFVLSIIYLHAIAQVKDTLHNTPRSNIYNYALKFIKKKKTDTTTQAPLTTKSEQAFLPYEGKIIRHILLNEYGFEKTFTDTAKHINYFGTRILNKLHTNTKPWVLRNALFIKEGTPLAAYRLADNERYLRTLNYIQDARIIVKPIADEPDSVDVYVITKDFFTLDASLSSLSASKFKASVADKDVGGLGQSVQLSTLLTKDRNPAFGFGLMYTKYNISHTFIDVSAGYSNINQDITYRSDDEHGGFISLQRNLVSQYSHFAGGFTIGEYKSINHYEKADYLFYDYKYSVIDGWIGYNLGVKKFIKNDTKRDKQFISLRYYNEDFQQTPQQVKGLLNFRYNSKEAILAQFTFFKQEYYKANYIYGFGVTEDIPYGYNIAFTSGFYKQAFLSRPYAGIDANRYQVDKAGDIVQYFLRAGSFWNAGKFQDAEVFGGISAFSHLFLFNLKLRQYVQISYARLFNRTGLDPLGINNPFGIRYFSADSVLGNQRASLHTETLSFINYKLFGFKFSPFLLADITSISPDNGFQRAQMFYGLGGGVRMRNENLVFRTIELRAIYFPRKGNQNSSFSASLVVNLAFKYNSNYVREPDIIQLNSDVQNNIF